MVSATSRRASHLAYVDEFERWWKTRCHAAYKEATDLRCGDMREGLGKLAAFDSNICDPQNHTGRL